MSAWAQLVSRNRAVVGVPHEIDLPELAKTLFKALIVSRKPGHPLHQLVVQRELAVCRPFVRAQIHCVDGRLPTHCRFPSSAHQTLDSRAPQPFLLSIVRGGCQAHPTADSHRASAVFPEVTCSMPLGHVPSEQAVPTGTHWGQYTVIMSGPTGDSIDRRTVGGQYTVFHGHAMPSDERDSSETCPEPPARTEPVRGPAPACNRVTRRASPVAGRPRSGPGRTRCRRTPTPSGTRWPGPGLPGPPPRGSSRRTSPQ